MGDPLHIAPTDWRSVAIPLVWVEGCVGDTHSFPSPVERLPATIICNCGTVTLSAIPSDDGGWDVVLATLPPSEEEETQ